MAAVRSAAFGCCVLSTVAGLVRIFWPENGFKPVINAVLALYIITAAVQIIRVADWAGIAAELAPTSDSSSVSDSEVGAYRRTLTDEAAAQALRDVLAASGIEAAIAVRIPAGRSRWCMRRTAKRPKPCLRPTAARSPMKSRQGGRHHESGPFRPVANPYQTYRRPAG